MVRHRRLCRGVVVIVSLSLTPSSCSSLPPVVRSTVPKIKLDDVFETKEEIALAVKEELTKSMHDFGYTILQALITDIDPDPKVKEGSSLGSSPATNRTQSNLDG